MWYASPFAVFNCRPHMSQNDCLALSGSGLVWLVPGVVWSFGTSSLWTGSDGIGLASSVHMTLKAGVLEQLAASTTVSASKHTTSVRSCPSSSTVTVWL
ncbi:hypothetical protein TNCV_335701 [Trichonephila clavipes]|nr:hypothetical protein TNCV_335701 [Trichonephila clavipes]